MPPAPRLLAAAAAAAVAALAAAAALGAAAYGSEVGGGVSETDRADAGGEVGVGVGGGGEDRSRRRFVVVDGTGGGVHSPRHDFNGCPPYGCPLLPRDVAFDNEARDALRTLRSSGLGSGDVASDVDAGGGSDGDDDDGSGSASSYESESEFESALLSLRSAGSGTSATLTLVGYKGGRLDDQTNQDRSFVIAPYLIGAAADDDDGGGVGPSGGVGENPQDAAAPPPPPSAAAAATAGPTCALLGVFDGHSHRGELVSEHAASRLPEILAGRLRSILLPPPSADVGGGSSASRTEEDAIRSALAETFVELDGTAPAGEGGGCTASVVLRLGSDVYLANAGDSRSLIATYASPVPGGGGGDGDGGGGAEESERRRTGFEDGRVDIARVTREDKPHLPDERSRIEGSGGTVSVPPPDRLAAGATSRVMYVDPASGARYGLAMSRSIGDWDAGRLGVIPDPIVERVSLVEVVAEAEAKAMAEAGCAAEAEVGEGGETTALSGATGSCSPSAGGGGDAVDVRVFAVSATDGLLDYSDLHDVAVRAARGLYDPTGPTLLTSCEDMVADAAGGWYRAKGGRYRDDIAVAVADLGDP